MQIVFDNDLLQLLRSRTNNRLSRYDAFLYLITEMLSSHTESGSFAVTHSELAKVWHWSRPTVQSFMDELVGMKLIRREKQGNLFKIFLGDNLSTKIHI